MPNKLTPPPPTGIGVLDRWLALLWHLLTAAGQILWSQIGGGSTPYVPFDTTATEPTRATGQIFWDDTAGTIAVHLKGNDVTLQVGQESHIRARNDTGVTIANGKVVYVSGALGNRPKIVLALADDPSTSVGTIGMATEDILNNADGYATTAGVVNGIDTSAFTEGDIVYLSSTVAGGLTNVEPAHPAVIVRVGTVTVANPAVGAILINIQLITRSSDEITMDHIGDTTYSSLQDLQDVFHSAGWVSGGAVTDNGDGTCAVALGTGAIRISNSETANLKFFDFPADTSIALTDLTLNWVYIDYNSGTPIAVSSTTEPTEHHTKVKLASIYRDGTTLHINQKVRYSIGDHAANMVWQMQEVMPYAHVSGAALSESGTRNLAVTDGVFWHGLSRFPTTGIDTSVTGSFATFYGDGLGGHTEVAGQTTVDNTQYDDGSGTLASLIALRYTNRWVYLSTDSEYHVIYGLGQFVSLGDAQEDVPPPDLPAEIINDSWLIGRIIVRQGSANFIQVDSAFRVTFTLSSVNDHGSLSGLTDLDHPASAIINTPAGNIVATTVQAAIDELDTEKLAIASLGTGVQTFLATPSSANLAAAVTDETGSGALVFGTSPTVSDPSVSGDLTLTSLGGRIRGDFSNGTLTNRAFVQTSTTNGATQLNLVPNGTGNTAGFGPFNSSDILNSGFLNIRINMTDSAINSGATGTGTALPLVLLTASTTRLTVGTSSGHITPGADNSQNFGSGSLRWQEIFAGNATINTSDAREKTPVRSLSTDELAVAKQLSSEIGMYQWLAAIGERGDSARLHCGMTVQRAMEIFIANGLDPFRYGLICYDEWEEKTTSEEVEADDTDAVIDGVKQVQATEKQIKYTNAVEVIDGVATLISKAEEYDAPVFDLLPVFDEAGNPVVEKDQQVTYKVPVMIEVPRYVKKTHTSAGNRYGFRGNELLLLIAAGFNARLNDLEQI